MKGANRYMKILLGTQSKIYVMLTHGKTHKYYFSIEWIVLKVALRNLLVRFPEMIKNCCLEKSILSDKMGEKNTKGTISYINMF